MAHPNKPQLAFAWMGKPEVLNPLWSALIQTPIGGQPPRVLMPNPQIIAAETELWSYRFSRCPYLADLLYMRSNARRQAALLWCKEGRAKPTQDEYKMLCYGGGCQLPVVVFVQNIEEATEEADQEEQETRAFLDALDFVADDAIFVYRSPQDGDTPQKLPSSILHLYQRLEQLLSVTAEQRVPLSIRCEEAKVLFFTSLDLDPKDLAPWMILVNEKGELPFATIEETVRQHSVGRIQAVTLRIRFDTAVSLVPERVFSAKFRSVAYGYGISAQECVVFV